LFNIILIVVTAGRGTPTAEVMTMRSDVHARALRAAAKVAFSVAFLGGCSGAQTGANDPLDGENTDGVDEAELKSGCHEVPPTPAKDASAPKLSCEQVVASAFPTEGDYPGAKQNVSAAVQTCCATLLEKSQGALAAHRWDCCANLPADAGQQVSIACTPWGPPVPPRMRRRSTALGLSVQVIA
jgi:hypothetical protein